MKFSDLKKIDAHMHYNSLETALLEQAQLDNFSLISINTDIPFFDSIYAQEKIIHILNSNMISYVSTFEMANWNNFDWSNLALKQVKQGIENGAIAIKFWKNIGMAQKDRNGDFIMINHPCFYPIFEYLIDKNIPVLGHLGEPKNCWLPLEDMTMNSDRDYFKEHPEYHMALLPNYPSYEQQLEVRDDVLKRYKNLKFIGAHLASLEWSIERIGKWLDEFPNAAVDLAERICHLQLQTRKNWKEVRDFFIKYQDRIMYGSDIIYDKTSNPSKIKNKAHQIWEQDWEFFTTENTMKVPQFEGSFKGLKLPDEVIIKIYRENALKWYPSLKS